MKKDITSLKIGVLGGGQLGRMLFQYAINFNLNVAFLDPDPHAPCANLTKDFSVGSLTDFETVYAFGKGKDLITIEIENVNIEALKQLELEGVNVFPQPHIIELIQDKRKQKTFYKANRIPTADFVLTENKTDAAKHLDFLPAVHKLGKEGYDGRGVQIIETASDWNKAFDRPGLLERKVDFDKELSVIVARNPAGEISTFPAVELSFHPEANLVEYLFCPAEVNAEISIKAKKIAIDIIQKLDMIGLLAVEMFLTKSGEILVNEIAPRTHNSGHQSIEGNTTSQFEQHLRAILNLPLGNTDLRLPSAMVNVLGEAGYSGKAIYEGLEEILKIEGVHVHLYGKLNTKPFRKMGHITITDTDIKRLKEKAIKIKETLKVKA